jgi:3-dehydroquinate dehydratase-1
MGELLCIKGRRIGEGKPLVCVPIMETTRAGIVGEAERLCERHVQMIEWRVDAFGEVSSLNAIREVLSELKPIVGDTILLYTFRSKAQGGLVELTADEILDIHQVAAESGAVDLIDIEYFEGKRPQREIAQLQERGVHVIASHHDFDETPERGVIRMLLEQMGESGADIVKLAVMPQSKEDVIALLAETSWFHETYPTQPLITMSMGTMGSISRIAGEAFGSCVTFGAGNCASAPGQLPADELETVLNIMHRASTVDERN